jgi:hypothetical protein
MRSPVAAASTPAAGVAPAATAGTGEVVYHERGGHSQSSSSHGDTNSGTRSADTIRSSFNELIQSLPLPLPRLKWSMKWLPVLLVIFTVTILLIFHMGHSPQPAGRNGGSGSVSGKDTYLRRQRDFNSVVGSRTEPVAAPTVSQSAYQAVASATLGPTAEPTKLPTAAPTSHPTHHPTIAPTASHADGQLYAHHNQGIDGGASLHFTRSPELVAPVDSNSNPMAVKENHWPIYFKQWSSSGPLVQPSSSDSFALLKQLQSAQFSHWNSEHLSAGPIEDSMNVTDMYRLALTQGDLCPAVLLNAHEEAIADILIRALYGHSKGAIGSFIEIRNANNGDPSIISTLALSVARRYPLLTSLLLRANNKQATSARSQSHPSADHSELLDVHDDVYAAVNSELQSADSQAGDHSKDAADNYNSENWIDAQCHVPATLPSNLFIGSASNLLDINQHRAEGSPASAAAPTLGNDCVQVLLDLTSMQTQTLQPFEYEHTLGKLICHCNYTIFPSRTPDMPYFGYWQSAEHLIYSSVSEYNKQAHNGLTLCNVSISAGDDFVTDLYRTPSSTTYSVVPAVSSSYSSSSSASGSSTTSSSSSSSSSVASSSSSSSSSSTGSSASNSYSRSSYSSSSSSSSSSLSSTDKQTLGALLVLTRTNVSAHTQSADKPSATSLESSRSYSSPYVHSYSQSSASTSAQDNEEPEAPLVMSTNSGRLSVSSLLTLYAIDSDSTVRLFAAMNRFTNMLSHALAYQVLVNKPQDKQLLSMTKRLALTNFTLETATSVLSSQLFTKLTLCGGEICADAHRSGDSGGVNVNALMKEFARRRHRLSSSAVEGASSSTVLEGRGLHVNMEAIDTIAVPEIPRSEAGQSLVATTLSPTAHPTAHPTASMPTAAGTSNSSVTQPEQVSHRRRLLDTSPNLFPLNNKVANTLWNLQALPGDSVDSDLEAVLDTLDADYLRQQQEEADNLRSPVPAPTYSSYSSYTSYSGSSLR